MTASGSDASAAGAQHDSTESGKPAADDAIPGAQSAELPNDFRQPNRVLPCGANMDTLLEQVANEQVGGLTDHQRACVHCQAALRELSDLWSPVRAAARTVVPVPKGFSTSVMNRVRAAADDTWYTLELTDGGRINVAARVVARLARNAARTVPGVRVALGRSMEAKLVRIVERATLGHRHPHAAVGVLGRTAVVDLALAIGFGDRAQDVARHVQQAVSEELRSQVGLKSVQINVTVDDVLEPSARDDRPHR